MQILFHILVTTVLLFALGALVPGIQIRNGKAALLGAVVLGLANAFVRPVVVFLTFPLTVITLGLFLWVVNALMLMLAAAVVDGFEVKGIGSALIGSLLLGIMNMVVTALFGI